MCASGVTWTYSALGAWLLLYCNTTPSVSLLYCHCITDTRSLCYNPVTWLCEGSYVDEGFKLIVNY
jgi:hypothetical protein